MFLKISDVQSQIIIIVGSKITLNSCLKAKNSLHTTIGLALNMFLLSLYKQIRS